jgi:hypothetical protein
MNWNFVALPITFDQPGTDARGDYTAVRQEEVRVESDGETVTFILPDGSRWCCGQEPLQAVVRWPPHWRPGSA